MASCGVSWDCLQRLWLTCTPWPMGPCGWAKVTCLFWVWAFDCKGGWFYSAFSLVWRHLGWRQLLQPHRKSPLHKSHRTKIMANNGNEGLLKILWDTDNEWARWKKNHSCFQPLGFEVVFYCCRTRTVLCATDILHNYPDVWIFRKNWEFWPHEAKFPTWPWVDGLSGSFIGGQDCPTLPQFPIYSLTLSLSLEASVTLSLPLLWTSAPKRCLETQTSSCGRENYPLGTLASSAWQLGMVDAHTVFATNELLRSRNDKISGGELPSCGSLTTPMAIYSTVSLHRFYSKGSEEDGRHWE